ncbi:MAG: ATP-dependent 6-phosphofructokinase [archaeon]
MRVGILTGGGDCPGLNAVIRAVVLNAEREKIEVIGFLDGWKGVIENSSRRISSADVNGIQSLGGTILGTSRTNPFKEEKRDVPKVLETIRKNKIDCLIVAGGEDTQGVAFKLSKLGLNIVGVPKTMDNDLSGTDFTFGFDTAVNNAAEMIDKLHSTANSHHRILVVEVFGRHAGWVALYSGIAGGAHYILIPESRVLLDEVAAAIKTRSAKGNDYSIVVVAEGCEFEGMKFAAKTDAFGHKQLKDLAVGEFVARELERMTGKEARSVVLGHTIRGGAPTAFDRVLATRLGEKAFELAKTGRFGQMASMKGTEISSVPISEAIGKLKTVPIEFYEAAKILFE